MKLNEFVKLVDAIGSWDFTRTSDGNFKLIREIQTKQKLVTNDFTGPYWIYAKFKLKGKEAIFRHNGELIKIKSKSFSLWFPPFSMIEITYENVKLKGEMLIGRDILEDNIASNPMVIYKDNEKLPLNLKSVLARVKKFSKDGQEISLSNCASALSLKCKKCLDQKFNSNIPISDISESLKTSHSYMTRTFKKDFGITPVFYRNWMRVMSASFLLLEQNSILETQEKVGFEDLSRFNKQFKRITHSTPRQFKPKRKSKNA